jgi:hypothetical protein
VRLIVSPIEVIPELEEDLGARIRRTVILTCDANEVAIGGGYEVIRGGNDITITQNRPDQNDPRSWIVVGRQIGEDDSAFRAYALCTETGTP